MAIGEFAISAFALSRGIDLSTMLALHREASEALAEKWHCDPAQVREEAHAASLLLTSNAFTPVAVGGQRLHALHLGFGRVWTSKSIPRSVTRDLFSQSKHAVGRPNRPVVGFLTGVAV